jgi:hypothetical protein
MINLDMGVVLLNRQCMRNCIYSTTGPLGRGTEKLILEAVRSGEKI